MADAFPINFMNYVKRVESARENYFNIFEQRSATESIEVTNMSDEFLNSERHKI